MCVCVYGVCFWLPSPTSRCRSARSGRGQDMNVMRGSLQRKQTGSSFRGKRERESEGEGKKRGTCSPEFTPGEPHPPRGPRTPVTAEFKYQCANRAWSAGADGQVAKMTARLIYPLRTDQLETGSSSSSSSILHTWPLCTVHVLLTL